MTSVHRHDDGRIFAKECRSLADAGFDTHLVAPGAPCDTIDGVRLHGVAKAPGGRAGRMTLTAWRVLRAAWEVDASIYHFHDAELIPAAMALRSAGRRVVYDAHEDLGEGIRSRPWIPAVARSGVSAGFRFLERLGAGAFSAVVAATPHIGEKIAGSCRDAEVIANYPVLEEFAFVSARLPRASAVCYVGVATEPRGFRETLASARLAGAPLLFAGTVYPASLLAEVRGTADWENTEFVGQLPRDRLHEVFSRAVAGLVLYRPGPNHDESQPNKLFEYMAAGLPVVASNFPGWREVVEGNACGVCVDPTDIRAVAAAIESISADPIKAAIMGKNGRRAVEQKYNWKSQAALLVGLYERILAESPSR